MRELALTGEKNLKKMLRCMSPVLTGGDYVFCTLKNARYGDYAEAKPLASFQEKEGLTLVLRKSVADNSDLSYDGVFRCITLGIHSSLEAVGLTAAVAGILANNSIAANVIAGYHHDHIFVPAAFAERAIGLLLEKSAKTP